MPKPKKAITETHESIADQLRALVRSAVESGNSVRGIARVAKVPPTAVVRLMNGHTLYLETAEALAKALGKRIRL